jgi:hypothetical protein
VRLAPFRESALKRVKVILAWEGISIMPNSVTACVVLLLAALFSFDAFAGEKEEAVVGKCTVASSTAVGFVGCVAAGWTGNEIETCLKTPNKCYGPNNELRKFFCAVGIGGCPQPPTPTELVRVLPFRGGCISIFQSGMYWSPDCQNLRGGGRTVNAWAVNQPHYAFVRGMVIFHDCVITAFNSGIYKSCNGINLGGGGETKKVYEGAPVESMTVTTYQGRLVLRTKFKNNPFYCDPTGDHPGGGGETTHC